MTTGLLAVVSVLYTAIAISALFRDHDPRTAGLFAGYAIANMALIIFPAKG